VTERNFRESEILLERALELIPLGSQTFSKSLTQYPKGVSPFYILKGNGCRVWDADHNEYTDFVSALGAIILGYNDPDVRTAVQKQLEDGTIFSLSHPIELEVAEAIIEMVPCAEMVRFGKNGSDVTSAAVRIARAATGRDMVAACGYHGWHDWYIGSTSRNRGVPESTQKLTETFAYNDLDSIHQLFKRHPGEIGAVILEPVQADPPKGQFLHELKALTHKNGALLIFDEIASGFRVARGGAQELYDIEPDLVALGKGMANGFPVSVIAGKSKYMKLLDEVFFSSTFGGETLSLAAANATLKKIRSQPVLETIRKTGTELMDRLRECIGAAGLQNILDVKGNPANSLLSIRDHATATQWEIRTYLLQEWIRSGILNLGVHCLNYCHGADEIEYLLEADKRIFGRLSEALNAGTLKDELLCDPLVPLFQVRKV